MKRNESGQIIIILLLIMLVALVVGLTITQRSITDITTSTQTEQATRANSAAEAGIDKAIAAVSAGGVPAAASITVAESELGNQSSANVRIATSLPRAEQALEYPPIGKESIAHFWLMHPNGIGPNYPTTDFSVYFGDPASPIPPAVEINLVTLDAGRYIPNRFYIDSDGSRVVSENNNFIPCPGTRPPSGAPPVFTINAFLNPPAINTTNSPNVGTPLDRNFRCRVQITPTQQPILVRVRVLYSNTPQPIAVAPRLGNSLPPQAEIYTSTGVSGQSQKTIQVFRQLKVVPFFFDFAIFSTGDIEKI